MINQIMTGPVLYSPGEPYRRTKIPGKAAFDWVGGSRAVTNGDFGHSAAFQNLLLLDLANPQAPRTLNTTESHPHYIVMLLWFDPQYLLTTAALLGIYVGFPQEVLRGLLVSLVRIAESQCFRSTDLPCWLLYSN